MSCRGVADGEAVPLSVPTHQAVMTSLLDLDQGQDSDLGP